jgi:3-isopropylmalate dehydrogenase
LSVAMMMRYTFGLDEVADQIENAVKTVISQGLRTADIFTPGSRKVGCTVMGDAVLAAL